MNNKYSGKEYFNYNLQIIFLKLFDVILSPILSIKYYGKNILILSIPVLILGFYSSKTNVWILILLNYITICYNHDVNKFLPLFSSETIVYDENIFRKICFFLDMLIISIVLLINYQLINYFINEKFNLLDCYLFSFYVISLFDFLKSMLFETK